MHLRITILCAVIATTLVVAFQLVTPPGDLVIWSADFETGDLSQWYHRAAMASSPGGGMFNSGIADAVLSPDQAHSGTWSLKMTIATPPESGARFFRWGESQKFPELFYTAWYYFPRQYRVANYWNVMQWKSAAENGRNDPFFVLDIGNRRDGSMFLYLYDCRKRQGYSQTLADMPAGRWVRVDAYYACAGDQSGRVMIWQDGALLIDVGQVETRYANGNCQWSVNNYSDKIDPSPAVIYLDDAEISLKKETGIP